jgi:hypothetical protein
LPLCDTEEVLVVAALLFVIRTQLGPRRRQHVSVLLVEELVKLRAPFVGLIILLAVGLALVSMGYTIGSSHSMQMKVLMMGYVCM